MKIILARKKGMTRLFDESGYPYPVTVLDYSDCRLLKNKSGKAIFLACGTKSKSSKSEFGIFGEGVVPEYVVNLNNDNNIDYDNYFQFLDNLKFGAKVYKVTGVSKGKGFAGVVKRWNFSGGPKTRGQSNKWRHPGSIGAGTTIGHVLKGLKMGGRMGSNTVTIKNLRLFSVDVNNKLLCLIGSVPGRYNSIVKLYFE